MFKNMSFGKLIAVVGGVIAAVVAATIFILRMNAHPKAGKQVTTKTYKHQPQEEASAASAPAFVVASAPAPDSVPASAPTNSPAITLASSGVGNDATIPANPVNSGAAAPTNDTRTSALDNSKCAPGAGPTKPKAAGKGHHSASASAVTKPRLDTARTALPGYKSMAVVNHRAWIMAPDGSEDSAVVGEEVPVPRTVRVQSMSSETGNVLTTTDQRIDANAPLPQPVTRSLRHSRSALQGSQEPEAFIDANGAQLGQQAAYPGVPARPTVAR